MYRVVKHYDLHVQSVKCPTKEHLVTYHFRIMSKIMLSFLLQLAILCQFSITDISIVDYSIHVQCV